MCVLLWFVILLPIFSSFILVKTTGLEGIYLAGDRIRVTLTSIFYPTWQNIRPPRVTASVLLFHHLLCFWLEEEKWISTKKNNNKTWTDLYQEVQAFFGSLCRIIIDQSGVLQLLLAARESGKSILLMKQIVFYIFFVFFCVCLFFVLKGVCKEVKNQY